MIEGCHHSNLLAYLTFSSDQQQYLFLILPFLTIALEDLPECLWLFTNSDSLNLSSWGGNWIKINLGVHGSHIVEET